MKPVKQNEKYRGARVLVTGASGFIGRWVSKLLSENGAFVFMIGKQQRHLDIISEQYSIQAEKISLDLEQSNVFEKLFKKIKPDITFNLVGYGVSRNEEDEKIAWRINGYLVKEIALVSANYSRSSWPGLRLVHVGSGFEYGSVSGPVTERTAPKPTTVYAKSKLLGTKTLHKIVKSTGLRAVTARLFTVYGPGEGPQRLLPSLMRVAKSGESLDLTMGEQERDFTYVKDVAVGLLELGLLSQAPGTVVNLATGNLTSVRHFVLSAKKILGIRLDQLKFGAIPYRKDEVWHGPVDTTLLKATTGWNPSYTMVDGIEDTLLYQDLPIDRVNKNKSGVQHEKNS